MKRYFMMIIAAMALCTLSVCGVKGETASSDAPKSTIIRFETTKGAITVKLYDDTPLHKANMVKLVKAGTYDGVLFHRIINNFMIQTGDPDTKHEVPDSLIGEGGVGYTVPAEIVYPKYIHRSGALAAAREGDDVNPTRASSGSQFYIVTGKKCDLATLRNYEERRNKPLLTAAYDSIAAPYAAELQNLRATGNNDAYCDLKDELLAKAEAAVADRLFHFNDEQKRIYTTEGGAPWLDGAYTVFGEVIEGMEVVLALQKVTVGEHNRPIEDVRVKRAIVVQE